jgi:hypothetical protein
MTETAGQGDKLNVFISYSRDDLAFAEQLYAALEAFGFGLAMDQRGIAAGEDWQKRLGALIRDADTVAFVLSPSSARSDMCAWEVGEAVRLGKRIIPVLCRSLEDAKAPEKLASLNYIFFYAEPKSDGSGFGSGLALLVKALNTDLDWLREHTRYLQRATEWDTGGRPASRLLSGPDIASAKAWAARRPKDAPAATPLQLDFIKASETDEIRQQSVEAQRLQEISEAQAAREKALADREKAQQLEAEARKSEAEAQKREAAEARRVAQRTMAGLAAALVLAVVAGWFAWTANQQRDVALEATRTANMQRDRAQLQESRALATLAQQASKEGDQPTAMLLALEALPDPGFGGKRPWSSEGAAALHQAWLRNRETVLAGHRGHVNSTSFGADDAHVVTASDDKTARVWDLRGERPSFVALEGHRDRVLSASLSVDGTHVVTASADRTARVWDLRSTPPTFVALEGHHGAVFSASFSTDGTHVVTASSDKTARVWDLRGERPSFVALEGHRDLVYFASFSADGTHVLTASLENTARVWDLRGERPSFVALEGHQRPVYSASFSADGTHVVTASGDKTARVWDLRGNARALSHSRGTAMQSLPRHSAPMARMLLRRRPTRRRGCGIWGRSHRALSPSRGTRVESTPRRSALTARMWSRRRWMGRRGCGICVQSHRALSSSKGTRVESTPRRSARTAHVWSGRFRTGPRVCGTCAGSSRMSWRSRDIGEWSNPRRSAPTERAW